MDPGSTIWPRANHRWSHPSSRGEKTLQMPKTTTPSPPKKLRVPKIQNNPIEHRNTKGYIRPVETQEFIQKAALLTPKERDQLLTPSEKVKAHQLKTQIEEQVRSNLGKTSGLALDNLIKLAFHADSEQGRARCTIDLLDRAGFKPIEKVQHIKAPRTPEEVEAELAAIVGKDQAEVLLGKRKLVN